MHINITCKQANVSPKNRVFPFESKQIRSKRPNTSVLLWLMVKTRVHPVLASFFNVTIIKSAETLKEANERTQQPQGKHQQDTRPDQ